MCSNGQEIKTIKFGDLDKEKFITEFQVLTGKMAIVEGEAEEKLVVSEIFELERIKKKLYVITNMQGKSTKVLNKSKVKKWFSRVQNKLDNDFLCITFRRRL